MKVLGAADVRAALPMARALDAVEAAFVASSRGEVQMPPRTVLDGPDGPTLVMPARGAGLAVCKVVSVRPGNEARGLPTHQGMVLVLDEATGAPLAALDGAALTALRTGAAAGVAARHLARADAGVLAVLGAGTQAGSCARAIALVRNLREARVWSRTPERAQALARELGARACASAGEAMRGADIVVTATPAKGPLFDARDLAEGALVCAMGSFTPAMAEVPPAALAKARICVDQREAARREAGDLLQAERAGALPPNVQHAELGEIIAGTRPGRRSGETWVFKSVGIAAQDLFAARAALGRPPRLAQSES
ncbi:MAG TPA: ornithine cyclodeaminase family protein [Candidatus Thermoplasmatota archaeon]|nr:ornithine cyclodeaminase family protein [Candidatus Thermoplasmatota archaeon]